MYCFLLWDYHKSILVGHKHLRKDGLSTLFSSGGSPPIRKHGSASMATRLPPLVAKDTEPTTSHIAWLTHGTSTALTENLHQLARLQVCLVPSTPKWLQTYRIAGILWGGGGKFFVVFVVERPTTNIYP